MFITNATLDQAHTTESPCLWPIRSGTWECWTSGCMWA